VENFAFLKPDGEKRSRNSGRKRHIKMVDPEKLKEYHSNPVNWVCACKSFLYSCFFICKHIIHCFEPASPEFFESVRRQTTSRFWKDSKLVLRPEIQGSDLEQGQQDNDTQQSESGSDSSQGESESDEEIVPMEVRVAE
jgi:hypothetical protein